MRAEAAACRAGGTRPQNPKAAARQGRSPNVVLRALPLLTLAACACAIELSPLETGLAAAGGSCRLLRRTSSIDARAPEVLVRFTARAAAAAESLRVEWIDPEGGIAMSSTYENLPAKRSVCVINALPVGGFEPATRPGKWRVRVAAGGQVLREQEFDLLGRPSSLSVRVAAASSTEIVLDSWGAGPDTTINVARYNEDGQWEYVAVLLPSRREGNRIRAVTPELEPGEYLVILRNPDGTESLPARFTIPAPDSYRKPFPEGERWRVSQGPYGSFSHYGRALHAWDFAPVEGRFVAAMRGGTVLARDLGLGQTPGERSFGNYITIRHDDGTYAHYAHLKSRSFRVRTGDRVRAGQILAVAGNSGYSFGRHVHVHVTRSPSIAAPSIPFRFADAPPQAEEISAGSAPEWKGAAAFAQWWSRPLKVPRGAQRLAVRVHWDPPEAELALFLVSPLGAWMQAEGREVEVARPQPGTWRVSVQCLKGDATFRIQPEITP